MQKALRGLELNLAGYKEIPGRAGADAGAFEKAPLDCNAL